MTPRLYIPHAIEENHTVELDEGQRRYLTRTLRLGPGAPLILFSGEGEEGEWRAELLQIANPAKARLVEFITRKRESPLRVTLIQGLAKGNSTELVIQKAVELGAATIIPLVGRRSVRRSPQKREDNKLLRWQSIVKEAAQQCGRVRLPTILAPMDWKELAGQLPEGPRYIFWEEQSRHENNLQLRDLPHPGGSVTLLVGPEGGLSREEVELAREKMGFTVVGLGPRILRTETAGLAVLSGCQILWGDMG